ncbi:hypothetical protein B0T24DRAFT_714689 [Lasiosphaeria ovina]|uniref:Uncharacterized protein n=1 Tax=Lasiosphaeria ovina TaxID=92902 RepID=A0AAE0NJE9_9PEZI|nr:hypothetical protein B0T24DRAFT_714689 [Lasiosphaeria ovina]
MTRIIHDYLANEATRHDTPSVSPLGDNTPESIPTEDDAADNNNSPAHSPPPYDEFLDAQRDQRTELPFFHFDPISSRSHRFHYAGVMLYTRMGLIEYGRHYLFPVLDVIDEGYQVGLDTARSRATSEGWGRRVVAGVEKMLGLNLASADQPAAELDMAVYQVELAAALGATGAAHCHNLEAVSLVYDVAQGVATEIKPGLKD